MSHHTWDFSRYKFLLGTAPVFVFTFLATVIGSSILTPINSTNAANPVTVSASVIRPAFALTLSVSPSVTLNLEPTLTGVMSVVSSTVSAATTSPSGYRLYLEMTGANSTDNSLIHTTDNNKKFTSSGTLKNPVALSNSTWGYAIAHEAPSANVENGFDASYTEMESASPTQAKFAAVPTSAGSAQRIAETNYAGGEDLTVYYGAKADYATASGAYTNKVLYTALVDDGTTPTVIATPNNILSIGGEGLSLTTSLYSTAGEITADAYLLTPAQYAAVTATENPTPVSTYSSQKMTCQRDTASDPLKLDCTTVAVAGGTNYVYVDVPHYSEHYAATITTTVPTYSISVTNNHTTSSVAGLDIPYGGSGTVTVTPSAGYYLSSVTCPSGYTCTGYSTGTSYTGQQTITITNNGTTSGGVLALTGAQASFTVTVTNSNTTSTVVSLQVPYGGSNTVTVTPSTGYYLSSVSCPSGFTCSGYTTGLSATGTQTVTITHNGATTGGIITFTGTSTPTTLSGMCSAASIGDTFTYSGTQYIKLKTNSTGTTSACYTKFSQGSATFANASSKCPTNTGVPSSSDFFDLIDAYGSDGTIYNTTGWLGIYWSSSERGSSEAAALNVYYSSANVFSNLQTYADDVVCIVR